MRPSAHPTKYYYLTQKGFELLRLQDSRGKIDVPIPPFKLIKTTKHTKPPKSLKQLKEDVSDEAFERRHLSSERLEKKEIRREREIEAYKLYIEKLKKEFPSHFA